MAFILVTGASGFIGSHVVDELLRQGYSVRGAVRSAKVPHVSKSYESFGNRFNIAIIDDLGASDLSQAVKGVDAVIHVASPLMNTADPQVILDGAVSGTTRLLNAAVTAGVKQVIVTASVASLVPRADCWKEITITEKSYNPQTVEEALQPGVPGFDVYCISKGLADLAVRDFKRAHPDLDLTTIHPSYVFGPVGTGQVYNSPGTGTNAFVYGLISGPVGRPVDGYPATGVPPMNVDVRDVARAHVRDVARAHVRDVARAHVRDVARAHVLALKVPPSPDAVKRFILSPNTFTWKEAVEFLAQARPELKGRLPVITGKEPPVAPGATCTFDTSASERILGLKNYVKWQDTILDTVDDMLRVEKELAVAAQ